MVTFQLFSYWRHYIYFSNLLSDGEYWNVCISAEKEVQKKLHVSLRRADMENVPWD